MTKSPQPTIPTEIDEAEFLRSQIVSLKTGRGQHRKFLPYVFTEQGVAMLSSVLKSERAVQVNVTIMRTFVKIRELLGTHADLVRRLDELEKKYDKQFAVVFEAIRQLMTPEPVPPSRRIGFSTEDEEREIAPRLLGTHATADCVWRRV